MKLEVLICDRCKRIVDKFKISLYFSAPSISFFSTLSLKAAGIRTSYSLCRKCYRDLRAFLKEDPNIDPFDPEAIELTNSEVMKRE